MKKLIILVVLTLLSLGLNAQNYSKSGNTYSSTKTVSSNTETKTQFVWKDSKNVEYPIYISAKGSCYIKRVSAKTNKEYKQYLGEEISGDICNQLGINYQGKSTAK